MTTNKLTCRDIKERQKNLVTDCYVSKTNQNVRYLFESLDSNYSFNTAKIILENWRDLADNEIDCFNKVLEVFGLVCKYDNNSSIRNVANIIEGNIIHKVRDGKATRHLNNYKLGKFKIQTTKAQNHNDDNNNAVKLAIANKGNLPNTLHPNRKYKRDIYGRKMGEVKKNSNEEKKEETIEEAFKSFEYAAWVNTQCDRVINNHNKLIKQFDLESKVRNCPPNEVSLQNCIFELCELIDTHDISFGVKYNIALENILYLMNKNCVKITDRFILETVTDYFLYTRDTTDDNINDMKYILDNSKFFTNEDVDYMKLMFDDYDDELSDDPLNNIIHEVSNDKDDKDIKKIIKDFKKANKKSINLLNSCITRIFVKPPELIIRNLPDIFGVIRTCFILGLFLVNPVIGCIGTITGFFIKMHLNRKEMDRVVNQYYKEKEKYEKKKKEAKDDKTKEKYEKIIKKFEDDIYKLETHESEFNSDETMDKKKEERFAKYYNSDDDFDIDFDFDDFDLNLEHYTEIVEMMSVLFESAIYNAKDISNTIRNNINNADANDIYQLTESVVLCNNIFDCSEYIHILEDALLSTRLVPGLQKYEKIDAIHNSISDVRKIQYDHLIETYDMDISIELLYDNLKHQLEVVDDTIEFFTRRVVSEGSTSSSKIEDKGLSFMSKLNIAKENLKRTTLKLKDKDKELSKKLDTNVDLFAKSAKNAMISENREAIIKGKLIPSASKCVHLAVATGLAWLVNPAIAVIGVLGYIGMTKKLQSKERRLIFDEIEVEIEMCDKYLRIAEDKNDMQAVRNIMQTKRSLERQRQRLRNGMRTEFRAASLPNKPFSPNSDNNND